MYVKRYFEQTTYNDENNIVNVVFILIEKQFCNEVHRDFFLKL